MNLPRNTYYYRPSVKPEGLTDAELIAIIKDGRVSEVVEI